MPNLIDITETVTETAARMRVALREQFPGVKFSVRSSRFAGGTSIGVSWVNGPTEAAVRPLTQGFRNSAPDALTGDYLDFLDPTLYADREGNLTQIRSGATFVSESRGYSDEVLAAAGEEIAAAAGDGKPFDPKRMYRVAIYVPLDDEPHAQLEAYASEAAFEYGGLLVCELLAHRDLRAA